MVDGVWLEAGWSVFMFHCVRCAAAVSAELLLVRAFVGQFSVR